jgi:SsrA-binding protein
MAKKKSNKNAKGYFTNDALVADNRRAKFDYHLEGIFEAGIMLTGTEVKSLRLGRCSINEAYVGPKNDAIYLLNANITEYSQAGAHLQHQPTRPRKLLLHKREIDKLMGAVTREGYTIVPVKLYFDKNGRAKIQIALAKGKKQHDKRDAVKDREWGRSKQRLLRDKN